MSNNMMEDTTFAICQEDESLRDERANWLRDAL